VQWKEEGLVGRLGVWHPAADAEQVYGRASPYSFMVRPYNVTTADAGPAFAACKRLGWETLACSPFVRGWELDKRAERAQAWDNENKEAVRARLADHMLRSAVFAADVDKLMGAVRRTEWVMRNVESERRGPLHAEEARWLAASGAG
jgi:aryl-alcohol dehydrogenase-like predicted oxidoreductase